MKKITLTVLAFLAGLTLMAQIIVISGDCVDAPVTLNNSGQFNGKDFYEGSGTVAGFQNIAIVIYWDTQENAWLLTYEGQPYLESQADTPKPPGTESTVFTWDAVETPVCSDPTPLSITGDVALWVHFGEISALFKNGQLRVNWETLKEQNNDHFVIEGSKDGQTFTSIATVASKAKEGNSDTTLHYEWVSSEVSLLFAGTLLIGLIAAFGPRRRLKVLLPVALLFALAGAGLGCQKNKEEINAQEDYYIRIAQVDHDGTSTYSKVIKVIQE